MSFLNGKPGPSGSGGSFDLRATLEASVFFDKVQGLLLSAKNDRNGNALRRGAICIDSAAFDLLPDEAQEDLIELYADAMMANGLGATG